jgi:hypothetical protein
VDPKIAQYTAKKLVEYLTRDPKVSPDLKRVVGEMMGADIKTIGYKKTNMLTASDDVAEFESERLVDVPCDYVTVIDANGKLRHLIFV